LRTQKTKIEWMAHQPSTNLSKPRGMVGIFEGKENHWITVGCNDKCLKSWEICESRD